MARRPLAVCIRLNRKEWRTVGRAIEISGVPRATWAAAVFLNAATEWEENPRMWTYEKDRILRDMYAAGYSDLQISERLELPVLQVTRRRQAHGLKARTRKPMEILEVSLCMRFNREEMGLLQQAAGDQRVSAWGKRVLLREALEIIEGEEALAELRRSAGLRVANATQNPAALDIDWAAQPLGIVSDVELARSLGVSRRTVLRHRTRLGIPAAPRTPTPEIDWDRQPLGQKPDTDLGDDLGVSSSLVRKERIARGIRPYGRGRPHKPSEIDWDKQPLGKVSDRELERRLGVSREEIALERKKRGIPRAPQPSPAGIEDWETKPLGELSDADFAKIEGVSTPTAYEQRTKRGILSPAERERRRQKKLKRDLLRDDH